MLRYRESNQMSLVNVIKLFFMICAGWSVPPLVVYNKSKILQTKVHVVPVMKGNYFFEIGYLAFMKEKSGKSDWKQRKKSKTTIFIQV